MPERESPLACDMDAITGHQRGAHLANIDRLFRRVEKVSEVANGYSFRLPNETEVLLAAAEFIALERLCCPFLGLALEIEREGGPVWLSLSGRDGVKPFIVAEIGHYLPIRIGQQS